MNRSPRKVFLFALPRSGSTMLCDRLSSSGHSVLLHEPMILRRFGDGREQRILRTLAKLGHDVSAIGPVKAGSVAKNWYDHEIIPHFRDYEFWGIKEVYLTDALQLIDQYAPDQILLLWRDPRDVALSFLELMNRALMSYSDRRTLKDEAWAIECLTDSAEQLHRIATAFPHRQFRYEELMVSESERQSLLRYAGLTEFGRDSIAMVSGHDQIRSAEVHRHSEAWSDQSIHRFSSEPAGWRRTFAEVCCARMQRYAVRAGYHLESNLADTACAAPRATNVIRVSDPHYEPGDGFDFAYAKRRGRRQASAWLRETDHVLDIGGTTASLAFMTRASVTVVDDGAPGKQVVSRDWRRGVLPKLDAFNLCTFIASLEFVRDPLRMLTSLLDRNLKLLVTYHCLDDVAKPIRESLHFRSELSRDDWQRWAASRNTPMEATWAFDGYQSLLRIGDYAQE